MNTSGSVTIEDGNPGEPNDFNPRRKVSVTIAYNTQEGDGSDGQAFLDGAADAANKKVDELLGRRVNPTVGTVPIAGTEPAKVRKLRTVKEPAVDTSASGSDKAALEAAAGLKPAEVVEEDSLDDLLGNQAPVPITDAELAKAAQNKNAQAKVKDPNFSVKIRALVVEYAGAPPKKITDVPVAKRQEFLDKLRDLA